MNVEGLYRKPTLVDEWSTLRRTGKPSSRN